MKRTDQGFAFLKVILAVVVVAALGAAGYFAYQQFTQSDSQLSVVDTTIEASEKSVSKNNFNCNDKFGITVPDKWHAYTIENSANCGVSNLDKSQLPANGQVSSENINLVFSLSPDMLLTAPAWAEQFITDLGNTATPLSDVSKEVVKMDNGGFAQLLKAGGGTIGGTNYYFFYKNSNNLGIMTSWSVGSSLSDQAKTVLKSIN